jgi:hypothetical protein
VKQRRRSAGIALVRADGAIDACATLLRAAGGCDCPCTRARVAAARLAR